MNEVLAQIEALLSANNGVVTYAQVLEAIPVQNHHFIPNALKLGKQNGSLHRDLQFDREARANTLFIRAGQRQEA